MELERFRKDAKALVRAFRAGDAGAAGRAVAVLGGRERERFVLSDAQHVVAVEHGYRTWPELRRAVAPAEQPSAWTVAPGIAYVPGEPVRIRVRVRRFPQVDDGGRAVELAGGSARLREVADQVARAYDVNVSRRGIVSLPAVPAGPGLEAIFDRVARASVALFEELLDADL